MNIRNMFKNRGFSLIEMLVVTAIIGLLASTMVFSYSQFVKQSQDTRRKTDLENIKAALEQYRSNNNVYPASVTFVAPNNNICDPGGCAVGIYMQKVPNDPKAANTYWYLNSGGNDYTLCTCLAGGGTSSAGNCGACPVATTCNYCLGPYGQK